MKLDLTRPIFDAHNAVAAENRGLLDKAGVFALNLMSSPGAGKTCLILATVDRLPPSISSGVIEGDPAARIDADIIAARGIPVTQINTGGGCHLHAPMIRAALDHLPLTDIDLLFVENVGNLICTANFVLGTHKQIVLASVPEGHDKPYKYPGMFAAADAVVLAKADVLRSFDFDLAYFRHGLDIVNPNIPLFAVSSRTGEGLDTWMAWLLQHILKPHLVLAAT
jgi:hydrogenase nickel incorporation protein HypB